MAEQKNPQAQPELSISEESPFGKALIGAKEGQEVIVEAPFGNIHYTVAKIER